MTNASRSWRLAFGVTLALGFATPGGLALAQSSNVPQVAPRNPSDVAPAEKPAPSLDSANCTSPDTEATGRASSDNLSDTLARNNGVICPPSGVDPDIRAPTPATGNTPVIPPPPGSPGGDLNIQPK